LEADSSQSGFNLVDCRGRLAEAYYSSGRYQDALLECAAARSYSLSAKNKKRLRGRLETLSEISRKSRKALAQKEPEQPQNR
jgi:hypothetical protein